MKKHISVDEAKELINKSFVLGSLSSSNPFSKGVSGNMYDLSGPKEIADCIVEFDGTFIGHNKNNGIIFIKSSESRYSLVPVDGTSYSASITDRSDKGAIKTGDNLSIIALNVEDGSLFVAVTIIRMDEKWIFERFKTLYGKALAIRNFYSFFKNSPGKQDYIISQLGGKKYRSYDSKNDICFDSIQEQLLKYALCKESFSYETQRAYESMFRDPNPSKHKTEQKLRYLSRIAPSYKDRTPVIKEDLIKLLNDRFYKMDLAKQQLIDVLVSNERASKRGFNILLVGGPGVGKTSIMNAVATARNIPSEIIPLNGMSCPLELEGLDSGYDSADAGRLIKVFSAHGTSEMVIGFDEIDKMNSYSKEGDPMNVLYRMLLGEHEDKFLGCTVSTENTIFIATANSLKNIPEPIKNRFNAIIQLDDYSTDDKIVIAKRHIVPEILKNFDLSNSGIAFSDDVLRLIATEYCEDGGARDLQHNIERIIRRFVSDGCENGSAYITTEKVRSVLSPLVAETPAIYFNRHRNEYSVSVAKEIQRCLLDTKDVSNIKSDTFDNDKKRSKVDYLLSCRNEEGRFQDSFDPVAFSDRLHKNLFGMDRVIKEATLFYHTVSLQGTVLNSNLALCGGFGIGKSTIIKNIADAMGYHFAKLSLNGVEDAKELRGFSSTYAGSEPGRVLKAIKNAGSLKTVFQLDEIDKMKPELSTVLLDLLDREFTDSFLDVPVGFEKTIFIATANDWGNVPAVVRDRFMVINVDGYSRDEKAEIVTDYIIPRIEKGYSSSCVSISIEDSARKYLLDTYCTSFGVRDAEKAMQKIVSSKLLDQVGSDDPTTVNIDKEDVRKYLGDEPIPRGNFPINGLQPGIAKALAVSNGNLGSTFAIETVLVGGDETLEMTGLPKETATDSVKIAVTCIKKMYPDLLRGKHIHVHFGEGSVPKDGPSAGVALFMSILSAAIDQPLMIANPYDVAYTGEISLTGGVFAVGGVYEKIQAASDSGCTKVFIPTQNYEHLDHAKLEQFSCEIVPVSQISQVVKAIFPDIAIPM